MLMPYLSPLFIAFLGLLSAIAVTSSLYYIAKALLHQTLPPRPPNEAQITRIQHHDGSIPSSNNSESQLITICKYTDEEKEDTCAVCLSEFAEGENIRVLSDCSHLYHVACIDTWLRTHPNCPLCRTKTVPLVQQSIVTIESSNRASSPESPRLPFFGI